MTTAERLIRNLCEDRRNDLKDEENTALEETGKIRFQEAGDDVAAAFLVIRRVTPQLEAAQKVIKKAGYDLPDAAELTEGVLDRAYQVKDRMKGATRRKFQRRRERIKALETEAIVNSIGAKDQELKAQLQVLQKRLTAI